MFRFLFPSQGQIFIYLNSLFSFFSKTGEEKCSTRQRPLFADALTFFIRRGFKNFRFL